jgi:hypothetical protein
MCSVSARSNCKSEQETEYFSRERHEDEEGKMTVARTKGGDKRLAGWMRARMEGLVSRVGGRAKTREGKFSPDQCGPVPLLALGEGEYIPSFLQDRTVILRMRG